MISDTVGLLTGWGSAVALAGTSNYIAKQTSDEGLRLCSALILGKVGSIFFNQIVQRRPSLEGPICKGFVITAPSLLLLMLIKNRFPV